MQVYRFDLKNIKFHEWKTSVGARLSKGSVLFLYESYDGNYFKLNFCCY